MHEDDPGRDAYTRCTKCGGLATISCICDEVAKKSMFTNLNMPIRFNISHRELTAWESRMYIPMEMFEGCEQQAQDNHSQTLDRLVNRAGVSPQEALSLLYKKRYREFESLDDWLAVKKLMDKYIEWKDLLEVIEKQRSDDRHG